MTGIGALPAVPHGKAFYWAIALFALAGGCMFTVETFASGRTPFGWRLVIAGIALVFLVGAAQALERLLRPEHSRARSGAWPDRIRQRLRIVHRTLVLICLTGFITAGLMQWIAHRRNVADIEVLSGVCLFAAYCLADLGGERLSSKSALTRQRA